MAKNIRAFLENLTDYFLNIIVNVNLGAAVKYFPKKILDHDILSSMVSWATRNVLKIF